jgi:thiamine-phosphate pyrophosphorylase
LPGDWDKEFSMVCDQGVVAVASRSNRDELLSKARLYVLLDLSAAQDEFTQRVRTLVDAGVHVLQLRDKRADDRQLLAAARLLHELTWGRNTLCVINDRPDIAALAGADGVHLGQDDLPVAEVRRIFGAQLLVGVSTHDVGQVQQAVRDGADYIGCGPTFPSRTKQFAEFPGLEFLRQVGRTAPCPAFAIGGIALDNLPQVLQAGFQRVAVGSSVVDAVDPAREARRMLHLLSSEPF